jgi:hypothetical protein
MITTTAGAAPTLNTKYEGAWATFRTPFGIASTASDFFVRIQWDDGSPDVTATVESDGAGGYLVKAPHTFTQGGSHTVYVSVSWVDDAALRPLVAIPVNVGATPIWLSNAVFNGHVGTPSGGVVATFYDSKQNDIGKYSATIDWGDGTSSAGTISIYGLNFTVFGTHTYSTPGTYTTVTTITNAGAVSGQAVGAIAVVAAPAPIGTPGSDTPVGSGSTPTIVSTLAQVLKKGATKLYLNYSSAIAKATATKLSRYKVVEAGKDGILGTKDDKSVKLTSATYNAKTNQVTLTPKGTFARTARFRVTITGEATVTALTVR